ncbi:hypothetical protein HPG69_009813, partial [Diceros bicornis minor]
MAQMSTPPSPAAHQMMQKTKIFLDNAIEFFQDAVSNEILQLLLTDEEAWKGLVAKAGLSRDEADALREGLNELNTGMAMEEKHMIEKDQLYRKKFMDEFPRVKQELEERIGKLHALADKVDKLSAKAEASRLTSIDSDKEMLKESLRHNAPHIGMETIGKNLRAIKLGKPKPHLVSPAVGLVTVGTVSVQSIKQVQKSFGGTALAMAKGARIMGAATA